jgi:UDP-2-acetamido-2,6-beta-L-arabino-hexul-4-ose reductase
MRIVVTGAEGFIGRNLRWRLRELGHDDVVALTRATPVPQWEERLRGADFVFHLAGVNRPPDPALYDAGNAGVTDALCRALARIGSEAPVIYASSTQAELDNAYGRSKRAAEKRLLAHARERGSAVHVFRLPNVFGKWSKPDYNSAVATFCHRIARGEAIVVHDAAAPLRLVYVDDVVAAFAALLAQRDAPGGFVEVGPTHETSVGELAATIRSFAESRESLVTPRVGSGLVRALYATYVSFLPPSAFAYDVPRHADPRGMFIEMLKTPDCGQFSCFTALPGVTRGGHYHHTKTEKFLVIAGTARFGFRNIESGEAHELVVRGGDARIVETVPGWTHDITNIADDELVVMLWANEVFDRQRPDTVAMQVRP